MTNVFSSVAYLLLLFNVELSEILNQLTINLLIISSNIATVTLHMYIHHNKKLHKISLFCYITHHVITTKLFIRAGDGAGRTDVSDVFTQVFSGHFTSLTSIRTRHREPWTVVEMVLWKQGETHFCVVSTWKNQSLFKKIKKLSLLNFLFYFVFFKETTISLLN